jgi:hypothetical protein
MANGCDVNAPSVLYSMLLLPAPLFTETATLEPVSLTNFQYLTQHINTLPERRAEAPLVRRRFASSPKDPRYHMLQHLSARFRQNASEQDREPRAALFLNRFTRTLTIMYATSGIEKIIGISSEDMKGRSFYYCIAEASLEEAVRVLESAKGNDSIAYVRFMFRDPRQGDEPIDNEMTEESDLTDAEMTDAGATETEEATPNVDQSPSNGTTEAHTTSGSASMSISSPSGASSAVAEASPIELEAVVSCTSDGLVVVLRRARPHVPPQMHDIKPATPVQQQPYTGYFAAPWGIQPIYYPSPPTSFAGTSMYPGMPPAYGGPPVTASAALPGVPNETEFLNAIKECGVFAWDLIGINGELSEYARGDPTGMSAPADGPAVWDPNYKEGDSTSSGRGTTS